MNHQPRESLAPGALIHARHALLQLAGLPSGLGAPRSDRLHVGYGIVGTIAASAAMIHDGSRMAFVRDRVKDHGLRAKSEGCIEPSEMDASVHWGSADVAATIGHIAVEDGPLAATQAVSASASGLPAASSGVEVTREDLLSVHHGRFITAAGKEVTSYYDSIPAVCDARRIGAVARDMLDLLDGCDAVVAPAYGGIPFAMALAALGSKPCIVIDVTDIANHTGPVSEGTFVPRAAMMVDDFTSVGSTFAKCIAHLARLGGGTLGLATVGAIRPGIVVEGHEVRSACCVNP